MYLCKTCLKEFDPDKIDADKEMRIHKKENPTHNRFNLYTGMFLYAEIGLD